MNDKIPSGLLTEHFKNKNKVLSIADCTILAGVSVSKFAIPTFPYLCNPQEKRLVDSRDFGGRKVRTPQSSKADNIRRS